MHVTVRAWAGVCVQEGNVRRRFHDIISGLEHSEVHWGAWAATFVGLVIARNLLEGALGPERVLGFTFFASPSALMVLDHFLLFYVSVFLGLSIALSLLAKEAVGRVMRVMTPAWALILIPPILDFAVTGGEGVSLSYLVDLRSVVLRFFVPGESLERVSVGQRVEILAACLLAGAYVRVKTASWIRAASAFVAGYVIIAAIGILPSAYARLSWAVSGGGTVRPELAYDAAFKAGGIVQAESRKLALLFSFTSCALGWWAYRLHRPIRERAFRLGFRPLRALHYVGMTPFGVALGWAIFSRGGVGFAGGGDALGVAGLCLSTFLAFEASVSLNDLFDATGDRAVGARRPLAMSSVTRRDTAARAGVLAAGALLLALNVKYSSFLLVTLALAVSFFYSAPPLRLKRLPLLGTMLLGVASLLSCLVGFAAFAEERAFALFPAPLAWLIVLSFGLGFAAKDLKDVEGDRATGVLTLPVILGPRGGRAAVAACVFAGFALVAVLLPFRSLALPAIVLGAWGVGMVYRWNRPRLDDLLLAVSLAFTLIVAIISIAQIDRLSDPATPLAEAKLNEFQGRRAEALHDSQTAAVHYSSAWARLRRDPDLATRTGVALFESGDLEAAWRVLFEANALDPSDPLSTEYLALSESRLGLRIEAEARMREAIRRGLRPGVHLALLGDHYLAVREAERAAAALAGALALGQPEVPTRLRLASALAASGRTADARTQFEIAVERRPSSDDAHDAYGRFLSVTGRPDEAVEEFSEAIEIDPAEPVYWNNLGAAYRDLGRFDEALAALDEATRLAPRMLDPYYNRGSLLLQAGRTNEARRQFLLALEIDPSFAPAREALERVAAPG
jgi:4-hydroxybenzoate polyprenyltransferase/Tfp pilus assembly protein PilF